MKCTMILDYGPQEKGALSDPIALREALLTPGERWFLGAVAKLPRLSEQQQSRLNAIAFKVELRRR